ncbi:hypothetical protein QBC47DRAFT_278888, partial [Echria macrotheca]
WSMTSVGQEELLAKMRYERQQAAAQDTVMSFDGTPLTPIQGGDVRWTSVSYSYMEPYMPTYRRRLGEMARREYEESVRGAFAESMQPAKDVSLVTATSPTYNPARADP